MYKSVFLSLSLSVALARERIERRGEIPRLTGAKQRYSCSTTPVAHLTTRMLLLYCLLHIVRMCARVRMYVYVGARWIGFYIYIYVHARFFRSAANTHEACASMLCVCVLLLEHKSTRQIENPVYRIRAYMQYSYIYIYVRAAV